MLSIVNVPPRISSRVSLRSRAFRPSSLIWRASPGDRLAVGVSDHRHQQPGVGGHGQPHVVAAVHADARFRTLLGIGGVELRVLLEGGDDRLHEERQVGEIDALRFSEAFSRALAQLREAGDVGLNRHPGDRDRAVRLRHVGGDRAARGGERCHRRRFGVRSARRRFRRRGRLDGRGRRGRRCGRGSPGGRSAEVRLHVLAGDAPALPGTRHQRQVDVLLGGEPQHRRRVEVPPLGRFPGGRGWRAIRARRGRGRRRRDRRRALGVGRGGSHRRLGRDGGRGLRRCGGGWRSRAGCDLQLRQRCADRHRLVLGHEDLRQPPADRRRDLDHRLVGFHLHQRLVALDGVALRLQPAGDGAFGHALADVGHRHARHGGSSPRGSMRPIAQ